MSSGCHKSASIPQVASMTRIICGCAAARTVWRICDDCDRDQSTSQDGRHSSHRGTIHPIHEVSMREFAGLARADFCLEGGEIHPDEGRPEFLDPGILITRVLVARRMHEARKSDGHGSGAPSRQARRGFRVSWAESPRTGGRTIRVRGCLGVLIAPLGSHQEDAAARLKKLREN